MKVKDILDNKRRRGEILQVGKTDAISSAVSIMVETTPVRSPYMTVLKSLSAC